MQNQLEIMWLCQGGFLFIIGDTRIVVDPYLSNSLLARGIDRMQAIPIAIEDLNPDYVCFTHDHADHFDEKTVTRLAKIYPNCQFVGPTSTFNHFLNLGLNINNPFIVIDNGENTQTDLFTVYAVPAYHTDRYAVGFIIKWAAHRALYISGDSEYYNTMHTDILAIAPKIDVAFICINGKLGNMNAEDAATLMNQIKPALAIPMHYGLFKENTTDPNIFITLMKQAGIKCMELTAGKSIII